MLKINMNSELIKRFYKIIQDINDNINSENYKSALGSVEEAFKEFFRLDSKFFNSLSEDNLLDIIKTNNIMDLYKCIIMSKLLMEEGIIYEKLYGENKSFYLYQKSLYLYIEALLNFDEESEINQYKSDIKILIDKLSEYKLSYKLQKQIVSYCIKEGEYDNAENFVYEMLQDSREDYKEYAISFYKELLSKDDDDLNKGRLPREEIIESLGSLEK
ncbi:MAG: DUF6483 family protein [Solirubrobacterales bacterium]